MDAFPGPEMLRQMLPYRRPSGASAAGTFHPIYRAAVQSLTGQGVQRIQLNLVTPDSLAIRTLLALACQPTDS